MCIACTASCGEAFMPGGMLESSLSSDNFIVIVLWLELFTSILCIWQWNAEGSAVAVT